MSKLAAFLWLCALVFAGLGVAFFRLESIGGVALTVLMFLAASLALLAAVEESRNRNAGAR